MQGGQSIPSRKEGGFEDVWGEDMDIADETEPVENWMSKRKNCRRRYEMSNDCH